MKYEDDSVESWWSYDEDGKEVLDCGIYQWWVSGIQETKKIETEQVSRTTQFHSSRPNSNSTDTI